MTKVLGTVKRALLVCLLAVSLWSLSPASFAAYSFVHSGTNNSTSVGAITASSITVTAHNALIVWIVTNNSGAQTVSGNGNTYTFVGSSGFANGVVLSAYFCQNANAGATAVATSDGGAFAIYAAEYSGLATSGGSLGFVSNAIGSLGNASNGVSTGATSSITAPAVAFAFLVDAAGIQTASPNTGNFNAGTTLAWTSRAPDPSWLTGSAVVDGRAEDIELTSTGTVTATFTATGNKQFSSGIAAVFALAETGAAPPPNNKMMLMGVSRLIHHKPKPATESTVTHKKAA